MCLLSLSLFQYAQAELCSPAEQRVELISGSGVYVTLPRLEEARREAKNGTQLARKLMDAFWDRETLARSSLSSKSKYQYQQLDPNVINAIEGQGTLDIACNFIHRICPRQVYLKEHVAGIPITVIKHRFMYALGMVVKLALFNAEVYRNMI